MLNVRPKSQKIKVYTNPVLSYDPAMTDVKKKNLKTVFKNICVYQKKSYITNRNIQFKSKSHLIIIISNGVNGLFKE